MTHPEAWRTDPRERLLAAIDRTWARGELGATPEQLVDDYTHQLAEKIRNQDYDPGAVEPIHLTVQADADLIAAGAPWTANHDDVARRIQDAATVEQRTVPDDDPRPVDTYQQTTGHVITCTAVFTGVCDCPPDAPDDTDTTEADDPHPANGAQWVARLAELHARWVKAGPPPIGQSINRWWDRRLAEFAAALDVDGASPELPDHTQCTGDEGFCPEHGFHRHSLKQPGVPDGMDTTREAEPYSAAEQLPDHLLALIDVPSYTSTACQTADALACTATYRHPLYDEIRKHAERLHNRCCMNQEFTGQHCGCGCH